MQRPAWSKFVCCKTSESRNRLNHNYCLHLQVGINVVLSRTSSVVHDLMNALSLAATCESYKKCSTDLDNSVEEPLCMRKMSDSHAHMKAR